MIIYRKTRYCVITVRLPSNQNLCFPLRQNLCFPHHQNLRFPHHQERQICGHEVWRNDARRLRHFAEANQALPWTACKLIMAACTSVSLLSLDGVLIEHCRSLDRIEGQNVNLTLKSSDEGRGHSLAWDRSAGRSARLSIAPTKNRDTHLQYLWRQNCPYSA